MLDYRRCIDIVHRLASIFSRVSNAQVCSREWLRIFMGKDI